MSIIRERNKNKKKLSGYIGEKRDYNSIQSQKKGSSLLIVEITCRKNCEQPSGASEIDKTSVRGKERRLEWNEKGHPRKPLGKES